MHSLAFAEALRDIRENMHLARFLKMLPELPNLKEDQLPGNYKREFSGLIHDIQIAVHERKESATISVLKELGIGWFSDPVILLSFLSDIGRNGSWSGVLSDEVVLKKWQHAFWQLTAFTEIVHAFESFVISSKVAESTEQPGAWTLEVADRDGRGISLGRLAEVASALDALLKALAEANGEEDIPISIAYADSGSPIWLGIRGGGKTVEALGNIFRDAANSIRFRRYEDFDRSLESVGKALGEVARIRDSVSQGSIDPETGQRLISAISARTEELLSFGVTPAVEPPPPPVASDRSLLQTFAARKQLTQGDNTSRPSDTA